MGIPCLSYCSLLCQPSLKVSHGGLKVGKHLLRWMTLIKFTWQYFKISLLKTIIDFFSNFVNIQPIITKIKYITNNETPIREMQTSFDITISVENLLFKLSHQSVAYGSCLNQRRTVWSESSVCRSQERNSNGER